MEQDLYRIIANGSIYLYLLGQYWGIANPETLANVFGANVDLTNVAELPGNPTFGPTIAPNSCLWQPTGSESIYFLCAGNNTAYWISSTTALQYYQFNGPVLQTSQVLSDWLRTLLTYGPSIDMPSAEELKEKAS